jgi:hypothetical protein
MPPAPGQAVHAVWYIGLELFRRCHFFRGTNRNPSNLLCENQNNHNQQD